MLLPRLVANGPTHARYWRKDLLEVYALALNKASGDEAHLVLDNGAELIQLDLVHPL